MPDRKIWFDAHPDLFRRNGGNPDSHACARRRAVDLSDIDPERVFLQDTNDRTGFLAVQVILEILGAPARTRGTRKG